MTEPALRPATEEDSEFAYETKRSAMREYVEMEWGWDEADQRRLHERRFSAPDVRIVSMDGEEVGVMALVVAPDCLKLNQIFLRPEHQGRGIGAWCMSRIVEEAGELGLPVRLRVLKVNSRAAVFYERLGFSRIGETDTHVTMERATRCASE